MLEHFDLIYQTFVYFAAVCSSTLDIYAVTMGGYLAFLSEAELHNNEVPGQRDADLNLIYEGVNATQTKADKFNNKRTLNRQVLTGRPTAP